MKFTVLEHEQRSLAWFAARAGRLTGSRAADMLAKIKTGEAAARRDYRLQLATERLTGLPQENGFVNAEMQRGIDCEPLAFAAYEAATGEVVRRTGFLCADDLMVGCSLDGDINDFAGIVEFKIPKSTTHIGYWKAGGVPLAYLPQLTHNLWVSGAQWVDFVSWDDRVPRGLQLYRYRLERDESQINVYAEAARQFLEEVAAEVKMLESLGR